MLHFQSAIFYGFMSTLMVFSNKYLFSIWHYNSPIFLILIEMITNLALIIWLNRTNFLSREFKVDTEIKQLFDVKKNPSKCKLQFLIALFYSLHSVLSLKALSGLNIPIYIMFKRCTPLANLILSIFIFKNMDSKTKHSKKIIFSIVCMTIGVIIAGIGDITFDLSSYIYCGFSVICQALYLSTIQRYGETHKTESSLQTFYQCSVLSIPLLTVYFLFSNETKTVPKDFSYSNEIGFLLVLALVIVSGSLLCFSQFWCTMKNNAITTSVLGVLKSIFQTLFSIILFKSWNTFSRLTYFGIVVNLVFGVLYTYLKYAESDHERKIKMNESIQSNQNEPVHDSEV